MLLAANADTNPKRKRGHRSPPRLRFGLVCLGCVMCCWVEPVAWVLVLESPMHRARLVLMQVW